MSRILIGLEGRAGCGKDTVAAILLQNGHHFFYRMAFADPLKEAAGILFHWPANAVGSNEFKAILDPFWNLTVRDVFQRLGTEAMRGTFGDDFWVRRWEKEFARYPTTNVVVTDVRFDNEAERIRSHGGVIVHIEREVAGLSGSEGQHASEQGIHWTEDDWVLDNNGTLPELKAQVELMLAELVKQ